MYAEEPKNFGLNRLRRTKNLGNKSRIKRAKIFELWPREH